MDPGFRTGAKLAAVDATGKFLESATIYPTPPESRVEEARRVLRQMIQEHGVELQLDSSADRTLSDPRRIRQIVLNLLSNAIKFGEGKPVKVTSARDGSGCIVIDVRDHGPGIPEEDQERIFEEFVQLETENKPGTGLDGVTSIMDPKLKDKKVGIQAGAPAGDYVAKAGLMPKAKPYLFIVDTRYENPMEEMIKDLRAGEIDVAILWGPYAGYYANKGEGDKPASE